MRMRSMVLGVMALSILACAGPLVAQQPATSAVAPDPMAVGKTALQKEDFASANEFFLRYTQENPQSNEALFLLGNSQLGLRQFEAAEKTFHAVLARDPKLWAAHFNLVLVYSESEQWKKFDEERALIASAQQAHAPGMPQQVSSAIDVFTVGGQRYIVREYLPPSGRFHTKYNFTWFGADGKLAGWISCESDDVDQTFFANKHPKEAAAGGRSYSLDGYTPRVQTSEGHFTQTHSTIKFYGDGEPTYEQVRADVMAVLQHKGVPISRSTMNGAESPSAAPSAAPPK